MKNKIKLYIPILLILQIFFLNCSKQHDEAVLPEAQVVVQGDNGGENEGGVIVKQPTSNKLSKSTKCIICGSIVVVGGLACILGGGGFSYCCYACSAASKVSSAAAAAQKGSIAKCCYNCCYSAASVNRPFF